MTHADRFSVLYVDDFEPERLLLAHRMRESSVGLTAVATVDDAIDTLNRRPFDVVISDLHLGEGRSGEDLLRVMQSGGLHEGPVVILTGESDASRLAPLLALGAAAVLTKPIDAGALPDIVAALATGRPTTALGTFDVGHMVRELPMCLESLTRAVERRDSETAARICRDLASTAAGYGLNSIGRQAEQAVGLIGGGMSTPEAREAIGRVTGSIRTILEAA